mmetsp:Transcript_18596/g.30948  ORF Transcript_18596/g.30948 Transcript_18596/m.30948 type:complete len:405 (-) Transcript_18596:381-1595(-)
MAPHAPHAQKIIAVLEEAIQRLQILAMITPELMSRLDELQDVLDEDIVETLREHRLLQTKYETAYSSSAQRGFDDQSGPQQTQDSEEAVDLCDSTKLLCRILQSSPEAYEKLKLLSGERAMDVVRFVSKLHELRNVISSKLAVTAEEEKQRQDLLQEMISREKKATQELKALQKELVHAKRERERAVRSRDETVGKLKEELADITVNKMQELKNLEKETKNRDEDASNVHTEKVKTVGNEVSQMSTELGRQLHEHRDNEEGLRKKKIKAEVEVENWIQKYDTEMGEKQTEVKQLEAAYTEERKQLEELSEFFERKRREEEAREAIRKKLEEEEQLRQRVQLYLFMAATRIQSLYRARMQRKAYRDLKAAGAKASDTAPWVSNCCFVNLLNVCPLGRQEQKSCQG